MTVRTRIAGLALAGALIAPGTSLAGTNEYGLPRALPADYERAAAATPQYGLPRALPADYAAYFANRPAPVTGGVIDWPSAGIGAGIALGTVLAGVLGAGLLRRRPFRLGAA